MVKIGDCQSAESGWWEGNNVVGAIESSHVVIETDGLSQIGCWVGAKELRGIDFAGGGLECAIGGKGTSSFIEDVG
jgi:hypothetical protein